MISGFTPEDPSVDWVFPIMLGDYPIFDIRFDLELLLLCLLLVALSVELLFYVV